MEQKEWMTMQQLQTYLNVSRSTIYQMIRHRELPFTPMSKRAYRFSKAQIDQWMASRAVSLEEALKKAT